jgi:hypothetical protein
MWGSHESMTCGVNGMYLNFGSFNGMHPIISFFIVGWVHRISDSTSEKNYRSHIKFMKLYERLVNFVDIDEL